MTKGIVISPNPSNRNSIPLINSRFLTISSMNPVLATSKLNDARHDVILAGGLNLHALFYFS